MRVIEEAVPRDLLPLYVLVAVGTIDHRALKCADALDLDVLPHPRALGVIVCPLDGVAQRFGRDLCRLLILWTAAKRLRVASLLLLDAQMVVHTGADDVQGNDGLTAFA